MPRRPRPAARQPPRNASSSLIQTSPSKPKSPLPPSDKSSSASEDGRSEKDFEDREDLSKQDEHSNEESEDYADAEADVPRVAQWVDDEDLQDDSDDEESSVDERDPQQSSLVRVYLMHRKAAAHSHNVDSFAKRLALVPHGCSRC